MNAFSNYAPPLKITVTKVSENIYYFREVMLDQQQKSEGGFGTA